MLLARNSLLDCRQSKQDRQYSPLDETAWATSLRLGSRVLARAQTDVRHAASRVAEGADQCVARMAAAFVSVIPSYRTVAKIRPGCTCSRQAKSWNTDYRHKTAEQCMFVGCSLPVRVTRCDVTSW
jgi:hypothetical protein